MSDLNKVKSKKVAFVDVFERLQKHLADPKADYPCDIIEKIVEQQEQSTPKLLEIAENFFTYSQRDITVAQWREAMIAFFILAKFREKKAFPLVARLCKFPKETVDKALGDVNIDSLSELLASTFNGDWQELYSIVSNQYLDEYSRAAVLDAYVILYKNDLMPRKQILDVLSKLFDELYDDFSYVPTALVCKCCDIRAIELSDKIKKYFEKNIVEDCFVDQEDVAGVFAFSAEEALENLKLRHLFDFVDELEDSMWVLFSDDEEDFEGCEDDCNLKCGSECSAGCCEDDILPF